MGTSLTKHLDIDNLPATEDDISAAIEKAVGGATTSGGSGDYLRFSGKTGVYKLGRNDDPVDPDQLYLVEPKSFVQGWTCWKANKPIDRLVWSIYDDDELGVAEEDLRSHGPYRESAGEGWVEMLGTGLIACDAVLSEVLFTSTSRSGRNSIGKMMVDAGARSKANEPHMPLIYFDSVTFEAQGNTNYKPVLRPEAWVTRSSAAAYLVGDLNLDQLVAGDKAKKRRKARKKK